MIRQITSEGGLKNRGSGGMASCNDWPYTTAAPPEPPIPTVAEQTLENAANFEAFCRMLRRALLMVVRWIEDKYGTG